MSNNDTYSTRLFPELPEDYYLFFSRIVAHLFTSCTGTLLSSNHTKSGVPAGHQENSIDNIVSASHNYTMKTTMTSSRSSKEVTQRAFFNLRAAIEEDSGKKRYFANISFPQYSVLCLQPLEKDKRYDKFSPYDDITDYQEDPTVFHMCTSAFISACEAIFSGRFCQRREAQSVSDTNGIPLLSSGPYRKQQANNEMSGQYKKISSCHNNYVHYDNKRFIILSSTTIIQNTTSQIVIRIESRAFYSPEIICIRFVDTPTEIKQTFLRYLMGGGATLGIITKENNYKNDKSVLQYPFNPSSTSSYPNNVPMSEVNQVTNKMKTELGQPKQNEKKDLPHHRLVQKPLHQQLHSTMISSASYPSGKNVSKEQIYSYQTVPTQPKHYSKVVSFQNNNQIRKTINILEEKQFPSTPLEQNIIPSQQSVLPVPKNLISTTIGSQPEIVSQPTNTPDISKKELLFKQNTLSSNVVGTTFHDRTNKIKRDHIEDSIEQKDSLLINESSNTNDQDPPVFKTLGVLGGLGVGAVSLLSQRATTGKGITRQFKTKSVASGSSEFSYTSFFRSIQTPQILTARTGALSQTGSLHSQSMMPPIRSSNTKNTCTSSNTSLTRRTTADMMNRLWRPMGLAAQEIVVNEWERKEREEREALLLDVVTTIPEEPPSVIHTVQQKDIIEDVD